MNSAEAFAAIAMASIACDGAVDPEEARFLRGLLDHRHPYVQSTEESMGRMFEGLLDQLTVHGWRSLVARAIPVLSPTQQETALAMAAHLVHCDRRVSGEEHKLLQELAALMNLPHGRAQQILDVITVLHRDSLAS